VLFFVFYWLTGFGVTIGYHRLLTHRSFDCKPWVRFIFIVLGIMSFEGTPQSWAALHLMHHKHSDHDEDPHSPINGFWHAHFGWMLGNFKDSRTRYGKWMDGDKMVQFLNNTTLFWMALRLYLPYLIDGKEGLIWGGAVALFWTHHSTWAVNSAAHTFGRRDFKTEDHSTNLWWVGLIGLGEGWHNGHHAFPWSARHGLLPRQFDASYQIIKGLEKLGLVWNVKVPTSEDIEVKKMGFVGVELDTADSETAIDNHEMVKALSPASL
jgi:stearoyl-CoA desaturase (delta-9 desaturase)